VVNGGYLRDDGGKESRDGEIFTSIGKCIRIWIWIPKRWRHGQEQEPAQHRTKQEEVDEKHKP